jgi:hypothetical protein
MHTRTQNNDPFSPAFLACGACEHLHPLCFHQDTLRKPQSFSSYSSFVGVQLIVQLLARVWLSIAHVCLPIFDSHILTHYDFFFGSSFRHLIVFGFLSTHQTLSKYVFMELLPLQDAKEERKEQGQRQDGPNGDSSDRR